MIKEIKRKIYSISRNNKKIARQYDKLTWYRRRFLLLVESDEKFAKRYYNKMTNRYLNLDNPQTFDDKLWFLKLHNRNPLLTQCSDKYAVREYIKSCNLEFTLNELYGVWCDARDIDFNQLPDTCFIKCNHVSGANIIYDRSKPFDKEDFIKRFNFILKQNYYVKSREWNYKDIAPKIIAEKVLRNKDGSLPIDYKFFCFNGEVKLAFIDVGVASESGSHAEDDEWQVYDLDFNPVDITIRVPSKISRHMSKPINWERMIEYAEIISKPFEHCRVDFYNIDGEVYFGEITFYHCGGCTMISPEEWDLRLGSWINIDKYR